MILRKIAVTGLVFACFICFNRCAGDESSIEYVDKNVDQTYNGSDEVSYVNTTGNVNLTYNLDLGSNTKEVYFIFSNISTSSETKPAVSSSMIAQSNSVNTVSPSIMRNSSQTKEYNGVEKFRENPKKYIDEYNAIHGTSPLYSTINIPTVRQEAVIGDTYTFLDYDSDSGVTSSIPAICMQKYTNADTGKTLYVYVANAVTGTITQSMVNTLAEKFMGTSGTGNIYSWVTNIFGSEWGTTIYSNLISETTANNEITILIYDIPGAGVLGYYYPKDNFTKSSFNPSNERLMFYLDSYYTANYMNMIISTLAHEFQHMIHFYQKYSLRMIESDTWFNEMCSVVTEDFVADKMLVNGPRDVAYSNASAAPVIPYQYRLDEYNTYADCSVSKWYGYSFNYGIVYSFGAFLARNYGGAELFRTMVQSNYENQAALVNAVNTVNSSSETLGSLLRNWGVAVLLSDNEYAATDTNKYIFNRGNNFVSETLDSFTYNLGSINLFQSGYGGSPVCYTKDTYSSFTTHECMSNVFYKAGDAVTGSNTWNIVLSDSQKLTVVFK